MKGTRTINDWLELANKGTPRKYLNCEEFFCDKEQVEKVLSNMDDPDSQEKFPMSSENTTTLE